MSLMAGTTTPRSDNQGIKVMVDPLHLDEIPDAMDKMNWHTAAKLMRHWFSIKPAWAMPDYIREGDKFDPSSLQPSQYNDDIVKIRWLLGFPQWADAAKKLAQTWDSTKGRDLLKKRLKKYKSTTSNNCEDDRNGKQSKSKVLGSDTMTARELDSVCQVNFTEVGSALEDRIDGLYGAIGKGTLKIAVVGRAYIQRGIDFFEVYKTGIYLRDTYDFNGQAEPLGVWNRDRCLGKAEWAVWATSPLQYRIMGFVPVFNNDFRRWQKAHNSGGDFVVYSDVLWQPPARDKKVIAL